MKVCTPFEAERCQRFNDTTGAFGYWSARGPTPASLHPDRCECQGKDPTPHKHYPEAPYSCARCSACQGYVPELLPWARAKTS